MRRIVSLLVTVVMLLTMIPVVAQAAPVDGEDVILNYGANGGAVELQGVELMASSGKQTFELADIAPGQSYKTMSPSQEIIDVIKDFEGFRSKAYWDKSQ